MTEDMQNPQLLTALERSRARRHETERQLRSLRGSPLHAPLAELDSLLGYELQLESRLTDILNRELTSAAR
jgi:hypothetical protein